MVCVVGLAWISLAQAQSPQDAKISRLIDIAERQYEATKRLESRVSSLESWRKDVDGTLEMLSQKYLGNAPSNGRKIPANGSNRQKVPVRLVSDEEEQADPGSGVVDGAGEFMVNGKDRYRYTYRIIPFK